MERHSLKNIKDNGTSLRDNNSSKVKDYSRDHNHSCSGGDYLSGFSWPPRSYPCSFCKRDFRSAQALGGHMNVHRRDRARLRQRSPPWEGQVPELNPNPNRNPDPNCTSSSHESRLPPFTYKFPSLLSTTTLNCFSSMPPAASCVEVKTTMESLHDTSSSLMVGTRKETKKALFGDEDLKGLMMKEDKYKVVITEDIVKLDLEIGLCKDSKGDLDLELRLGYS